MKHETLDTIAKRRSIRQFKDTPVDNATIQQILSAANRAPSAHNQQSWRFIVLRGERTQQLAQLAVESSSRFPKPASSILRMAARSVSNAPVVIAVVNSGALMEHGKKLFKINESAGHDFFRTMEIQSSAAAVQNLLLAATALGLGSVWLGILFLIKDEVREYLGEPKGEFMAVIPIGYSLKEQGEPRKKGLEYVVKYL
jgi:nitroreductase